MNIQSGEDIRHLGELDRKLWTVLSCPTQGLEFDEKTLKYIDVDNDGKIRVDEVIKTAQWLTRVIKDADLLLEGRDVLEFSNFNEEDPDGARLLSSARQILKNLGEEKESVSVEDTADFTKIFAGTLFNGDGIITPASAGEDEALAKLIETIAGISSALDRSGVPGITADHIEAFYAACADFKAWKEAGTKEVFPFGDKTPDALAAVEALKDKVADYFMRCKLIGFDEATSAALDVNVDKIAAIEGNGQSELLEAICGLRKPDSGKVFVCGKDVTGKPPGVVREAGLAHIPEDRLATGVSPEASISDNLLTGRHDDKEFLRFGFHLRTDVIRRYTKELYEGYDIRSGGIDTPAEDMSGGNLQKLVVAREFSFDTPVLVIAQPTRGVDIGASEFIHRRIMEKRGLGCAILLSSADLDEVLRLSDRIITLYEGRITGEFAAEGITREQLGWYMTGDRTQEAST